MAVTVHSSDVRNGIDDALKAMRDTSHKQLFADLNVHGGAQKISSLVDSARNAAMDAVRNSTVTDAAAQKQLAQDTFKRVLRNQAGAHLADSGRVGYAISNSARNVFSGVGDGFRRIFNMAKPGEVTSRPPGWFSRNASKFPNWVGKTVKAHPILAALGATGAVVGTGMHFLSSREKNRAEADYSAQIQQVQALQQQAYAMENAARGPNPFYGGVTAEEAAAMEAQMRRNGGQQGGFAAAERQRRAAASAELG